MTHVLNAYVRRRRDVVASGAIITRMVGYVDSVSAYRGERVDRTENSS